MCVKLVVHGSKYTSERVYGLLLCRRWVTPTLLYNGNCVIVRNRLPVSPCSFTLPQFLHFLNSILCCCFSFSCNTRTQTESLTGHYIRGLVNVSYTATSPLLPFSESVRHVHGTVRKSSRIMSSALSDFHSSSCFLREALKFLMTLVVWQNPFDCTCQSKSWA